MSIKEKITRGIAAGGIGLAALLSDGCASTPAGNAVQSYGLQVLSGSVNPSAQGAPIAALGLGAASVAAGARAQQQISQSGASQININLGNNIPQNNPAREIVGEIDSLDIDYNTIDENGNKCVKVISTYHLLNANGQKIMYAIRAFDDNTGRPLMDRDGQYKFPYDGGVATYTIVRPTLDASQFTTTLTLPFRQFDFIERGSKDIKFKGSIIKTEPSPLVLDEKVAGVGIYGD